MKIDRLLGILIILLKNDMVTAPMLAEHFEVSRRTINRDIEDLCKAGIPVVTIQGTGGGIKIADGYKIDKTLLSGKEMQAILAGLKSLDSVSGTREYQHLMDKILPQDIGEEKNIYDASGNIVIDLASHYKGSLSEKMALFKEAMEKNRLVEFDYYAISGESHRTIEPYLLIFQWKGWYLYGFCLQRQDYRLFKLNRLVNPQLKEEIYRKRNYPMPNLDVDEMYHDNIKLKVLFAKNCKWQLIDEYGIESFKETEEGLLFEGHFANKDSMMSWLFSFGNQVTILEPSQIKEEYLMMIEAIREKYRET